MRLAPYASRLLSLLLLALTALCAAAYHPANIASARAKVGVDGSVDIRIRFDILAFILDEKPNEVGDGEMKALLDLPEDTLTARLKDAESRFRKNFQLAGNGTVDSFTFPASTEIEDWVRKNGRDMLPMMLTATAKAHFDRATRTSAFHFPEVLDTVVLTTEFPYQEPISEPVDPGNTSQPLPIPTAAQVSAVQKAMTSPRSAGVPPPKAEDSKSGVGVPPAKTPPTKRVQGTPKDQEHTAKAVYTPAKAPTPHLPSASDTPEPKAALPSVSGTAKAPQQQAALQNSPSALTQLPSYLRMGFTHILPQGLDHILFVLGLFLLSTRTKDLLKQITAFTVAHSLTLALSLYGVVRLPASVVEPIIAASIAFVAIENIFTTKMKSWRVYMVFAFGLVHGLGFASALKDLGLAKANFLTALVGFNAGVELGQLTVVLAAFLAVGWFRSHERYRPYIAVPASCAIALIALFWTVQRLI